MPLYGLSHGTSLTGDIGERENARARLDPRVRSSHDRQVSRHELSQHCQQDDCWMAIHGKVYDVSRYVKLHPGGAQVMLKYGGRDATAAFDDVGHTFESLIYDLEPRECVGVLDLPAPHARREHETRRVPGEPPRWDHLWEWVRGSPEPVLPREIVDTSWEPSEKTSNFYEGSDDSDLNKQSFLHRALRRIASNSALSALVICCMLVLVYLRMRWPTMVEHVVAHASEHVSTSTSDEIPRWSIMES
ncbi:LAMI_0G12332g1_1 [Lachancea mirantina]|uniref:LAMI_0G12332g1_1 n=1 Tax=Lachancea mirantina TaxID=1230905 RepID=A0A1G4KBC5_9SACH|nr:LAMI_0G12332g1_1 [Lachancea mirantina]